MIKAAAAAYPLHLRPWEKEFRTKTFSQRFQIGLLFSSPLFPMPRRKALKGVMHSFLRSFTSRYSDYNGYWMFGLVTSELDNLTINLLKVENTTNNEVIFFLARLAQREFREQMDKAKLPMLFVRQAQMLVMQSDTPTKGFVAGHLCTGHNFIFSVQVVSDLGRPFRATTHMFIAPHNSAVEHRSTRRI